MTVGLAYSHVGQLPRWVNAGLVLAAVAAFWTDWQYTASPRFIGGGIPAALLVAGASLGNYAPAGPFWRVTAILGDASYALYLFHAFSIHAMIFLFRWTGVEVELHRTLCLIATICTSFLMAVAIHYGFERPITRTLRSHLAFGGAKSPIRPTRTEIVGSTPSAPA
jgi:peptidoglycan/LPS O-acetylase OafA/YrhL